MVTDGQEYQLARTCVVVLGAVSQILLLLQHELREGEIVGDLNGVFREPLKDQVVHGVTDWDKKRRQKILKGVKAAAAPAHCCRQRTPKSSFL